MFFPRQIRRLPKWAILALTLALLAGTARTVWASCAGDRNEQFVLEIESVQVDGVAQEDISSYERQTISLTAYYSADTLLLSTAGPGAFSDTFVARMEATDE